MQVFIIKPRFTLLLLIVGVFFLAESPSAVEAIWGKVAKEGVKAGVRVIKSPAGKQAISRVASTAKQAVKQAAKKVVRVVASVSKKVSPPAAAARPSPGSVGKLAGSVKKVAGQGGIINPGRKIGPSGKPVQHFTQLNSRKAAQNAAQNAGKGNKPVYHPPHKNGQRPHYHPADKNGNIIKDGSHYEFPEKQG